MQKVLSFLEAKVEWVALGLAVLFLGWTVYTYLINDPVSKTLDNTQVNPGTVDDFIDKHAAEHLRDIMDPNAPLPNFDVPDFTQAIQKSLSLDPVHPPQLAETSFDYDPFDVSSMPQTARNMGPPVLQLPTPPVPQPLLIAAALDTISPAAPAAAAPAVNPAPQLADGGGGKDVRLVVAAFTIPWNDLYTQWNKSFGPAGAGQPPRLTPADFLIVAVTAYRSEMINGVWTPDEEIQLLNGQDLPPYPAAGNKNAAGEYLLALSKAPKTLVAPDFPAVSAGVAWKDPIQYLPASANTPNPGQNGAMNQPAGARIINSSDSPAAVSVQYNRGGGPGGPGGFRGPPPGFMRPQVPQNVPPVEQPAPPSAIPPAPGTVDPVVTLANPAAPPNPAPVESFTKLNLIGAAPKSPDLCMYIIDETAQAGKTYRYRISYKALNPLFNKPPQRVGPKGQNWVNQFDLESKVSDYSPAIEVPKQTYFFCGKPQGGIKATFPFEVFTWTDGKWLKDIFNASKGDPIGGLDSGINYFTGWTYADARTARGNKQLVTLVADDGRIEIRDISQDSSSPDYKQASQWVDQTKAGGPAPVMPSVGGPMPYGPSGGAPPGYGPQP